MTMTLDRTTTGHGAVAATALADIRGLDAGGWFADAWRGARVPTLEEAIGLLEECGLNANIEIKPCPGREVETAAAVVACLRRHLAGGPAPAAALELRPGQSGGGARRGARDPARPAPLGQARGLECRGAEPGLRQRALRGARI